MIKINSYSIFKCSNCGLIFTNPLPEDKDLDEYYQGFLFNEPKPDKIKKQIESRTNELNAHFIPKSDDLSQISFLDYGGGTGAMFEAARKTGYDAFYFDIYKESVGFVKNNFGLSEDEQIKDLSLKGRTFDYIWSDNVIEHVKDPSLFIKTLYDSLNPDGKLIIKTPQASNTETCFVFALSMLSYFKRAVKENSLMKSLASVLRYRFWHCEPPRHLYAFSKKSILEIAESLDIDKSRIKMSDYYMSMFLYSLPYTFFKMPNTLFKYVFGLAIIPFIIPEFFVILLRVLLSKLGLISGTGLIIKIIK
ncbi:MAG: hypothetical protein C0596_07620 [Marinilabiliales bacterium]|nr:MAG: hypothetical protein C0596_07620 [Marinilabiliales bacterium]